MSIYIFAGPTITKKEIHELLPESIVLPPIKRGDLLSLSLKRGDTILIIDGYFYQQPAIQHMEIINTIKSGVTVFGCSSMGALRAAELYPVGMIGVGYIFECYRNHIINGDDEVAVLHDSENYVTYSEALVNIRFNLEKAVKKKIISQQIHDLIIDYCKNSWFGVRTLDSIYRFLRKNQLNQQSQQLEEFFNQDYTDIKKQDAIHALNVIRSLYFHAPLPDHETCFNRNLKREYLLIDENSHIKESQVFTYCRLFEPQFPEIYKKVALKILLDQLAPDIQFEQTEEPDNIIDFLKTFNYSLDLIHHWIYPLKQEPGILWTEPIISELKRNGLFDRNYEKLKAGLHIDRLKKRNLKECVTFLMRQWNVKNMDDFLCEIKRRGYQDLSHLWIDLKRLCS